MNLLLELIYSPRFFLGEHGNQERTRLVDLRSHVIYSERGLTLLFNSLWHMKMSYFPPYELESKLLLY